MNIWLISDPHFGKYNNDSDKWLSLMTSYFYDFLIPMIKEHKKKDDVLFLLGDLYDNRNSINLKTINAVIELFETLGKLIPCHVLLGNHDMYLMNSPEINSISTIRNIEGITIYDKPTQIILDGVSIAIMPWLHAKDNEKEILEKYKGNDLLFCHSDLNGCRTQLYPTRPHSRNILDIDDFVGYEKVYSGHIHIRQTINNFTFVGAPYHLDRNDIGNTKGIHVYNTKKRKDFFIENDFSPEFKKIKLYKESDLKTLEKELQTINFIDLEISNNLIINNPKIRLELDKIINKHKILNIDYINDVVDVKKTERVQKYNKTKTIKDVSLEWINNLVINEKTDLFKEIELKNKMKQTVDECFDLMNINKK